ncbi:hypothetical protein BP5796_07747 [Coleophoma crateriformis]|uniref:Acetyl-CoA synthetase-like protein n=1 Tax=Coleophoma crateriformis TaxID=565419 RepID=A0A3D8RCC8_9HELO|nr:hypothetical protein BP5796_07747 [Coleophoma crateriformis]
MDIVSWTFARAKSPERSLSSRTVRTLVRQLVNGLQQQGLAKGDTVCVLNFNDIYYTTLYLGIIGSGGCFTGANPGYTPYELAHHLRITDAKYLLTGPKTLQVAIEAAGECGLPLSRIFVLNLHGEEIAKGHQSWEKLLQSGEKDWLRGFDAANTPAAYVSTSGTSGLPKAAIITHSYMVSQAQVIGHVIAIPAKKSQLIAIPPFHVLTIPNQHAFPLRQGAPCYIMPRYEQEGFMNAVDKFSISMTTVVPPILMSLSKSDHTQSLHSLRSIHVGGSCATDGMQQQLYEKLHPDARILQVYGMTEAGWASTWQDRKKDQSGSVGKPLPGTKFRLVDHNGTIVKKDGMRGEIHIRSPHPMKGYLNNPKATSEAFSDDGWVKSGDVGYVRNGKWYVIDRTKDLIKVRGWQVSPAEIEAALLEHPAIMDAAVIGMASRDGLGEEPQGFVVRRAGSNLQKDEVKSFLRERLARYKGVEDVKFVDRIPRNPAGKILRRVLRDARGVHPRAPDEAAALAYSNAIRSMERYQQERSVGEQHLIEDVRGRRRRSSSLTDASTIGTSMPPSPVWEEKVTPDNTHKAMKRKAEDLCGPKIKRRSSRFSLSGESA